MDDSTPSQLNIQIACEGATDEELDRMTRQLLSYLRDTNVESAELAAGGTAPSGAKGDPITLGSIVVSAMPTLLPGVFALVQSCLAVGPGRTVKVKWQDFEFEGPPEQLDKAYKIFTRGKAHR
jgi:hypothetical protein